MGANFVKAPTPGLVLVLVVLLQLVWLDKSASSTAVVASQFQIRSLSLKDNHTLPVNVRVRILANQDFMRVYIKRKNLVLTEVLGPQFFSSLKRTSLSFHEVDQLLVNQVLVPPKTAFYLDSQKKIQAIASIALERYVMGVVQAELSADWPLEALKAQAIVSRTYVMNQIAQEKSLFDVEATTQDQVFKWREKVPPRVIKAVLATKGLVLESTQTGELLSGNFHAHCGGHTDVATDVWPHRSQPVRALAALPVTAKSTKDPYCQTGYPMEWSLELSAQELKQRLNTLSENRATIKKIENVKVLQTLSSGRVQKIAIEQKRHGQDALVIEADQFRKAIGYGQLRSSLFKVERKPRNIFVFRGQGYGHGVGLCQWGTKAMAEQGKSAEQILAHYF